MNTFFNSLLMAGTPAIAAAVGFLVVATFQIALALGAPFGRAAWSGNHPGQLPTGLRVSSTVAVAVWMFAAQIVLGRVGFVVSPFPYAFHWWGTWMLVGVLSVGALMNFASRSAWERLLWGPFTLTLAGLCFLVARISSGPAGG